MENRKLNTIDEAFTIQTDAAKVGFDWPCSKDVLNKLDEELEELKQAILNNDAANIEEEIGDLFYTLINLSRHLQVNPNKALQLSSNKFTHRFECLKALAEKENLDLQISSLEQLETLWQRIKRK